MSRNPKYSPGTRTVLTIFNIWTEPHSIYGRVSSWREYVSQIAESEDMDLAEEALKLVRKKIFDTVEEADEYRWQVEQDNRDDRRQWWHVTNYQLTPFREVADGHIYEDKLSYQTYGEIFEPSLGYEKYLAPKAEHKGEKGKVAPKNKKWLKLFKQGIAIAKQCAELLDNEEGYWMDEASIQLSFILKNEKTVMENLDRVDWDSVVDHEMRQALEGVQEYIETWGPDLPAERVDTVMKDVSSFFDDSYDQARQRFIPHVVKTSPKQLPETDLPSEDLLKDHLVQAETMDSLMLSEKYEIRWIGVNQIERERPMCATVYDHYDIHSPRYKKLTTKSRDVFEWIIEYFHAEYICPYIGWIEEKKDLLSMATTKVFIGKEKADLTLLDQIQTSVLVVAPHFSKKEPQGFWLITRSDRHPLCQMFNDVELYCFLSNPLSNRRTFAHNKPVHPAVKFRNNQNGKYVNHVALVRSEKAAKKWLKEAYPKNMYRGYPPAARIQKMSGRDILDIFNITDVVDIEGEVIQIKNDWTSTFDWGGFQVSWFLPEWWLAGGHGWKDTEIELVSSAEKLHEKLVG